MKTLLLSLFVLTAAAAWAAEWNLSFDLGNGARLELVLVPHGKFQQGSPAS